MGKQNGDTEWRIYYTDIERIEDELAYAKEVMHQLHCTVLDVSNKAIEETASRIMSIIERNKELYGDKYWQMMKSPEGNFRGFFCAGMILWIHLR